MELIIFATDALFTMYSEAPAANALGAVLGNVTASYTVELVANYDGGMVSSYTISGDENAQYETYEEALIAAEKAAREKAEEQVKKKGAAEYTLSVSSKKMAPLIEGTEMFFRPAR